VEERRKLSVEGGGEEGAGGGAGEGQEAGEATEANGQKGESNTGASLLGMYLLFQEISLIRFLKEESFVKYPP
jgi:hypothetical protein